MPETIYVRNCNIVNGELPCTVKQNTVFESVTYIRADTCPSREELEKVDDFLQRIQTISAHMQSKRSLDLNKLSTEAREILEKYTGGK
jgi:hypothetical protein